MSELQKMIAKAVSDVRDQIKPMSLAEKEVIAKKAKVTLRTIYNVMQPDYKPKMATLEDIQKALKAVQKK